MPFNQKRSSAVFLILAMFFLMIFPFVSFADELPQSDTKLLLQKFDNLEKENASLQSEVANLKNQVAALEQATKEVKVAPTGAAPAKAQEKPAVTSKFPAEIYGYIKADAIYNDNQLGELPYNAPSQNKYKQNDEFKITAKETRLGINLKGPEFGKKGKVNGKIEGDFWGDATDATTSSTFRIRQAYAEILYDKWSLLGGQAWDYFSPLNPSTLDFSILWRAGNLGTRHPMVKTSYKIENFFGGVLTPTIGAIDSKAEEQADAGTPVFGSYVNYDREVFGKPLTIGIGNLLGNSNVSTTNSKEATIWAATFSAKLKLCKKLSIMGEGYVGQDLYKFMGGSSIGIDHRKSVKSQGGWAQITYDLLEKWQCNLGIGADDVDTRALAASPTTDLWDMNYSYFTNLRYKLTPDVEIGVEYQRFWTDYPQQVGASDNQFRSSLIYKF